MFALRIAYLLTALFLSVPLVAASQTTGGDISQPGSSSSSSSSTNKKTRADTQWVYGSQLMTPEERRAYHDKMRAAKTPQAREQLRREHHAEMQARAKERGVTLPDEPPARSGRGMGMGMRPGSGSGPGCSAGTAGCGMGTAPGASSK